MGLASAALGLIGIYFLLSPWLTPVLLGTALVVYAGLCRWIYLRAYSSRPVALELNWDHASLACLYGESGEPCEFPLAGYSTALPGAVVLWGQQRQQASSQLLLWKRCFTVTDWRLLMIFLRYRDPSDE